MVGTEPLVSVTLAWLLMSAKTPGVKGFGQSSLAGAGLNVTGEPPNSSKSVNTSAVIHAWDSEQSDNGTTPSCPCDLNECKIRFCCLPGHSYAFEENDCAEDTLSFQAPGFEESIKNFHFVSGVFDKCNAIQYPRNGSICMEEFVDYLHATDYCVYRQPNTSNYRIALCNDTSNWKHSGKDLLFDWWYFACLGFAAVVALATLIVYSLVPELKNFQGRIVRSYLASYFSCMMLAATLLYDNRTHQLSPLFVLEILVLMWTYSGLACLLWLTVMSFDIWKRFRKFRSSQAVHVKDRERATFVRYSMYAWGTPVLIGGVRWELNQIPGAGRLLLIGMKLAFFAIFICNTYFFISTALKIKKCNKETAQMVDGANKHHQKNKQWFNLYLKLFILMGGPIVLWAVYFATGSWMFLLVGISVEPLQAICVFYMFVWKDDVKKSIRKQCAGMMRRLGSCRQRASTTGVVHN